MTGHHLTGRACAPLIICLLIFFALGMSEGSKVNSNVSDSCDPKDDSSSGISKLKSLGQAAPSFSWLQPRIESQVFHMLQRISSTQTGSSTVESQYTYSNSSERLWRIDTLFHSHRFMGNPAIWGSFHQSENQSLFLWWRGWGWGYFWVSWWPGEKIELPV